MGIHKAIIIENDSLRLGASDRNIHEFSEVHAAELPVVKKNLVKKSCIIRKYKCLEEECRSYMLPRIFASCLAGSKRYVPAVTSGKRALAFPQKKYDLDLKDLGLSEESVKQEFIVDVKGCGIKWKYSEKISEEELAGFINKHGIKGLPNNLDDELVFSRNRYLEFNSSEGASRFDIESYAIGAFESFLQVGFKLAPLVCVIPYPEEVQMLASEFDGDDIIRDRLVQEKRLMPSFLRAAYLEQNNGRNPELVRLISEDERSMKAAAGSFIEDMVVYFENLAVNTEKKGRCYYWDYVGDISHLFEEPGKILDRNYSWYLAKDLVLARSGMYFVDHEGCTLSQKASSIEELKSQQRLYLTLLLKDFFRITTNYNIAVENEMDRNKMRRIEEESREAIVRRLNDSDYLKIERDMDGFHIKINYAEIEPLSYKINANHLQRVVR